MWIKTTRGVLLNTNALTSINYDNNFTYGYIPGKNIIISNYDSRDEIISAICDGRNYLEVQ